MHGTVDDRLRRRTVPPRLDSRLVHRYDADTEALSQAVLEYALHRLRLDPVPLDGPRTAAELDQAAGAARQRGGHRRPGGPRPVRRGAGPGLHLDRPPALPVVHPVRPDRGQLAVRPGRRRLRPLRRLLAGGRGRGATPRTPRCAGWPTWPACPSRAGGVFVPGGTVGNLSALVAARHAARTAHTGELPARWKVAGTSQAHSSIKSACDVMDVDFIGVPVDDAGPADRGQPARDARRASAPTASSPSSRRPAPPTSASSTTSPRWPRSARELGVWFHVDGAYGGAGLAAPQHPRTCTTASSTPTRSSSTRTSGSSRRSTAARCSTATRRWPGRRTPRRPATSTSSPTRADWNPSDYSIGLTRRARGLPFWFCLATHGTDAYTEAVERTLEVTRFAASEIKRRDYVELLREPGPVGGGVPPDRLDAAAVPGLVGPAAGRRTSPSSCRPRTRARR